MARDSLGRGHTGHLLGRSPSLPQGMGDGDVGPDVRLRQPRGLAGRGRLALLALDAFRMGRGPAALGGTTLTWDWISFRVYLPYLLAGLAWGWLFFKLTTRKDS